MATLFDREIKLNLGGVLVSSRLQPRGRTLLRVAFKIERNGQREPNTAEIQVWNLKQSTRTLLAEEESVPVSVDAGYVDRASEIFKGSVGPATSKREGPDWVTTFQSTDGGKAFKTARVNTSFKGGVGVAQVLRAAANALGVDPGNFEEQLKKGNLRGAIKEFKKGAVLSGNAALEVDKLAKTFGFEWSIQNGELQFTPKGKPINPNQAVLLTPKTGLVGVPEVGEKGIVVARSLLQPELTPKKRIKIESETVTGFYQIERSVFSGDTWGSDWYTEVEAVPL